MIKWRISLSCLIFCLAISFSFEAYAQKTEENYYLAGKKARKNGNHLQAIENLSLYLTEHPEDPKVYYELALSYYDLELYSLALNAFLESGKRYEKTPPEVNFSLGLTYYQLHQFKPSVEALEKVLNTPDIPSKLKERTQEWFKFMKTEGINQIVKEDSLYKQGINAAAQQRYSEAIQSFTKLLEEYSQSSELHYRLGFTYLINQNYKKADKHFKLMIEVDPESDDAQTAKKYIQKLSVIIRNNASNTVITKDIRDSASNLFIIKNISSSSPFYFFLTLGSQLDSNINFAGPIPLNSQPGDEGILFNSPLQDGTGVSNIITGYRYRLPDSPHGLQVRYSYLINQNFGLNDSPQRIINSDRFNFQAHQFSLLTDFGLSELLNLAINYNFDWQLLANQSFQISHRISPILTIYENSLLRSRAYSTISSEWYPEIENEGLTNLNYVLGLEQFIFLWNADTWLRFSYEFQEVKARDNIISIDPDGAFPQESLSANSRSSNAIGMSLNIPLWWNSQLTLQSNLNFINFTQPDIFRQLRRRVHPLTGVVLPSEAIGNPTSKYRKDTQLLFALTYDLPITNTWSVIARYNRITNVSNILSEDFDDNRSRSYLKDVFGLFVRMKF